MRRFLLASAAALAAVSAAPLASAQTLKVVMHSDLKVLDPIWSGAYIVRNHGYMLYDTLFAMDEQFQIKPQMVDTWSVSDDGLTWTFKLRDGLEWHDGTPVTAEDCIASLKRWAVRDSMGLKLSQSLARTTRSSTPRPSRWCSRRSSGRCSNRSASRPSSCPS